MPVRAARVVFTPVAPNAPVANAVTDSQGNFTLASLAAEDGCCPGRYIVTVTKQKQDDGSAIDLPVGYEDPETSDLTTSVAVDGNTFHFDLKDSHP